MTIDPLERPRKPKATAQATGAKKPPPARTPKTERSTNPVVDLERYVPAFLTFLHDKILGIALERERALPAVLDKKERDTLIGLLKRLHENLPAVEGATTRYVAHKFPHATGKRRRAQGPADE